MRFYIFRRSEEYCMHNCTPLRRPCSTLPAEYAVGNVVFAKKIESLSKSFANLRRTRGDGNCFYRAFLFSYLENLLLTSNMEECGRYNQTFLIDQLPSISSFRFCSPSIKLLPSHSGLLSVSRDGARSSSTAAFRNLSLRMRWICCWIRSPPLVAR